MALTITPTMRRSVGNKAEVSGTLAFDNSYTTGGLAFTLASVGLSALDELRLQPPITGYVPVWDGSTSAPKVMAFYGDNNNAADGPLIEVPNATNLSTVTNVRFTAIGA